MKFFTQVVRHIYDRYVGYIHEVHEYIRHAGVGVPICAILTKVATIPKNHDLKIFFEHTYLTWFFSLFVVYIREIRS